MADVLDFLVDVSGERLDKYLREQCPDLSRSQLQKLIGEGSVTVNRAGAKSGLLLNHGDKVSIIMPSPPADTLKPAAIPLRILYEDDDLLVVNKPAGLNVHPAPGHPEQTLVNAVLAHYPRLAEIGDAVRPGIVHRLDKDTSGVMMVAKNQRAQSDLQQQFKEHRVKKDYLVLVKGKLAPEQGIINAAIGRDPGNRKKMAVVRGGREARTDYRVVKYLDNFTLLEVTLETGRTHQIRVHLRAIGYPVVGDVTYGVKSPHLSRQFLHAYRLGFRLPSTGENVEFTAELPEDLQRALEKIG
ncbi:RluA family pseudouridine synthase [Chloroflexota bacterium]